MIFCFFKGNSAHILLDADDLVGTAAAKEGSEILSNRSPNSADLNAAANDLSKLNRIPIDSVVFHEKLGSGQFGDVYRGVYRKNVRIYRKKFNSIFL